MSAIDDLLGIEESWEDILETANQLETLITDGLEWVEHNPEKIIGSLTDIQEEISKLDFSNPLPQDMITNATDLVKDMLDPALKKLHELEGDVTPKAIIDLIESSMPSLPEMPQGIKDLGSPLKKIAEALINKDFSIALEGLSNGTNGNSTGTNNGGGDETQTRGYSSAILSELESHFQTFFSKNNRKDSIESLMTQTSAKLGQDIDLLKNEFQDAIKKLGSPQEASSQNIFAVIEQLVQSQGHSSTKLVQDVFQIMSGEMNTIRTLITDLLTEPLDADTELCEMYQALTSTQAPPSLLEILSLLAAIPIHLTAKGVGLEQLSLPQSLSQLTDDEKKRYRIYGGMQLFDGFLSAIDAICSPIFNFPFSILPSILVDLFSAIANILAQAYSTPSGMPMSIQCRSFDQHIWGYQWFLCVGIKICSFLFKLTLWIFGPPRPDKEESYNKGEIGYNIFEICGEIAHLGLFWKFFDMSKSDAEPDQRIKDCYILDPFSAILGDLCSIGSNWASNKKKKDVEWMFSGLETFFVLAFQMTYGGMYIEVARSS